MEPKLMKAFVEASARIGVHLDDAQHLLFSKYFDDLCVWNGKMNLISVRDNAEIVLKHFLDALTPLPFLPRHELDLLDIGTGPGLPGIPLKIAEDKWRVHLLEASRKRTSFLKETIRHLSLQNVTVIHSRVEDVVDQALHESFFDVVISRATFKLPQLIDVSSYFLKKGGVLVAMKGEIPDDEWTLSEQVSENKGLFRVGCHDVPEPFTNTPRKILIYNKLN